jgi:hypothetical protein
MCKIGRLDFQRDGVAIENAASDTAKLVVMGAQQCVPRRAEFARFLALAVQLGHAATPLRDD